MSSTPQASGEAKMKAKATYVGEKLVWVDVDLGNCGRASGPVIDIAEVKRANAQMIASFGYGGKP